METNNATLACQLLAALSWIVEFCSEHPEWFGQGNPDEGSEFEWLDNARQLVAKANQSIT